MTAPTARVSMPAAVTSLVSIARSSSVAVGLGDGRIAIWNGREATAPTFATPHTQRVLAVGASAEGRSVLSVAIDGVLARSSIASGAAEGPRRTVDLGKAATRAAVFSTDGTRLITGGEFGELRVFDTATGALQHRMHGHRSELQDLAPRPQSTLVASAGAEADLRVWDTATGRQVGFVDGDLSLFALAFSPRDGTLAAGGPDRRMTLRDAKTFESRGVFALPAPKMVSTLAWSPDGGAIAVGDLDDATLAKGGIQLVDAARRVAVGTLDTGGAPASRLVFLADGSRLVAVVERELRAWPLP